jgi:hypothetical protein
MNEGQTSKNHFKEWPQRPYNSGTKAENFINHRASPVPHTIGRHAGSQHKRGGLRGARVPEGMALGGKRHSA